MTISASRIAGGQGLEFRSSIRGGWHEAIGVALFGDIPDAGEGEVTANERELILRRHIENPLSRLGGRPGIVVKAEYPVGMAEGNRRVCDEVPRKEEILARRRQEKLYAPGVWPGRDTTLTPMMAYLPCAAKTMRPTARSRNFDESLNKKCSNWHVGRSQARCGGGR
jgi:hypothetical protein